MSAHPFIIVPWSDHFAARLHQFIIAVTGGKADDALIVFPNKRPRRYLIDAFARDTPEGETALLPGTMDIGQFTRLCLQECGERPLRHVSAPDAAAILMECLQGCADEAAASPDIAALRELSGNMRLFYPWGVRLAALLDECDANLIDHERLAHEALPFDDMDAADGDAAGRSRRVRELLLSNIRIIARLYHAKMQSHGFSSPGLDSGRAARLIGERGVPPALKGKTLIFAGFVLLNKSEDALLQRFWQENGAWICLRSDPAVTGSKGWHWSCSDHKQWLGAWKADAKTFAEWRREWLEQDSGHEKMLKGWSRDAAAGGESPGRAGGTGRQVRFFAGYDLHSQLACLSRVLKEERQEDGEKGRMRPVAGQDGHVQPPTTAIVLSHDSLLRPVLSALPGSAGGGRSPRVNISLGYPLGRLPIAQLVERVLQANETADAKGRLHWKELRAVFRHPCLRMLALHDGGTPVTADDGTPVAAAGCLQRIERYLRRNERMIDLQALRSAVRHDAALEDPERPALPGPGRDYGPREPSPLAHGDVAADFLDSLISAATGWQEAKTLRGLGSRLEAFLLFILEHGRERLRNSPWDSTCLAVLLQSVLPALTDSLLADKDLGGQDADAESMPFAILRQQIAAQRVPFESAPEEGTEEDDAAGMAIPVPVQDSGDGSHAGSLQVLGMLETRLLQFDRVHILDLTEDALPGEPRRDPLLPDAVRRALGLPDSSHRDRLAAHTFHSLLAGTGKKAFLYWQEGVQSGMMDKKIRSRFVEEMLWECEKREGKLLKHPDAPGSPLLKARFMVPPLQGGAGLNIEKTPEIDVRLWDLLTRTGLSASSINSYLRCPRQFFLRSLCGLKPPEEPGEEEDPASVGTLMHNFLHAFFRSSSKTDRSITEHTDRAALAGKLSKAFSDLMQGNDPFPGQQGSAENAKLVADLPPHTYFFLKEAGPHRLQKFAGAIPEGEILFLETGLSCGSLFNGRDILLTGRADRIDKRGGGLVILDYKTGSTDPHLPDTGFWHDLDLWERMASWEAGGDDDPLPDLARQLKSIQLPLYLHLAKHTADRRISQYAPVNAALVDLRDTGGEKTLFTEDQAQEEREGILEDKVPALLDFICRHMTQSEVFSRSQDSKICTSCPFAASCGTSS